MIFYDKWPVRIRTALKEDLPKIAAELRKEDAEEVKASHGHTPLEALTYSFDGAEKVFTYLYKAKPVALFGVTPTENKDFGSVWCLAADELYETWLTFTRQSKPFIERMGENYRVLFNFVDARNTRSVRWLGWCGAKFDEAKPYGLAGLPFHYFTIEKETCHV